MIVGPSSKASHITLKCEDCLQIREVHINLESVAFELYKRGPLTFDSSTVTYQIAPSLREE